ncbi:hypothetical protein CH300_20220 [Rhodococcus sp. 15-1154-1]|nr:hypothetical protein [Rhodococcus sp. 15-1154-1]OZF00864.1 hypothetical protein CH300_20220 [Rhodococcus sp. 15-1154-1]
MAPEGIAELIRDNPTLVTIFGIVLIGGYVVRVLSQASETFSKLVPVLGKRWREQANRAARREQERRDELARKREDENQVIADLERRLEYFVTQVKDMKTAAEAKQAAQEIKDDYLTYDAEWHALNEIHAAEHGYQFLPPKHMTFNEFRRATEEGLT